VFQRFRQFPLYSKTEPPAVLKEHFKDDTFKKSQEYGIDKAKFSLYSGLFRQVLDSVLLHYGVYAWSWDVAGSIGTAIGYGPEHEVS
jgi:STE24 endopeptidase